MMRTPFLPRRPIDVLAPGEASRLVVEGGKVAIRVARYFGFDRDDARFVVKLGIQIATVIAWSATAGVALHTFMTTSGIGRVMGWDF